MSQTIEYYQNEKHKCDTEINNSNQQLAVANSNLERLKEEAKAQFGTDNINKLAELSNTLAQELAQSESVLQSLDAGIQQ